MSTQCFIYLIEAENGFVKIGRGQRVAEREKAIRVHSPLKTRLIGYWPGSEVDEAALHERFRDQRRHGEWFEQTGECGSFVQRCRGVGVTEILSWDELDFRNRGFFQTRRAMRARAAARGENQHNKPGAKASPTKVGLTLRQSQALRYIGDYNFLNGCSPSYQEIANHFGLASKSSVSRLIHGLVARGYVAIAPNCSRSLILTSPDAAIGKPLSEAA